MSETYSIDVPVQFRDLDPLEHVNHAVYASYLETARVHYFSDVLGEYYEQASFIVANLEISYLQPIVRDDEPTVSVTVTDLGESSFTMTYEIDVDDGVAATAETVLVQIDAETGDPTPIPEPIRTRFQADAGLERTV
ncbi:acyl-CoA thioesterase [Salinadaptatus halalkaliphilus]|uniref:Acyl-CoA thioesterase n=1 Tax=Salinadaptatus halalkaliphilus TaxID=2419781 RepID=A0A4S3TIX2_9EURY|nr:thioesterase family protein [Salinadaptatus halalkaliphilus]THE63510.1 acyl-CoA thioesterase [Salinadaptatus halalkaliphilus]